MALLPNLIHLKLNNNEIVSLQALSKKNSAPVGDEGGQLQIRWPSLEILDLSYNKVTEIDELNCPKLKNLNLGWNEVRKIESLEGAENLEILNLCNNQISDFSKIKGLKILRELYLV